MTREEAIKWFKENPFYNENHKPFLMAIEALKTDVVRCKGCKYFEPDLIPIPYFEGDGACFHEHWTLEDVGFEVKEIDFCSYGERKE